MHIQVEHVRALRFDDGSPVRAASAVVAFGGGWLVAQDDATHAAWLQGDRVRSVRVLPPVAGLETFAESAGTKHLKPDVEAAFGVPGLDGAVVLLGSGSSPARTHGALITPGPDGPHAVVADLAPLYASAARVLGVSPDLLNLEGACVVGDVLRWFQRGLPRAGSPTGSVDVDLPALVAALSGGGDGTGVRLSEATTYDLGTVDGVGLAVTDAVALGDGSLLVSAAAEDTPDPREDGPVIGSVLAVLRDGVVASSARLPPLEGAVPKVEGLAVVDAGGAAGVRLMATVDSDDPTAASLAVTMRVRWDEPR